MNETSGELRPAVEAYLKGEVLTPGHIAALRAYLRQWIDSPVWMSGDDEVDQLRCGIDALNSRAAIDLWLSAAAEIGIDPL
jgi:hypothetical protein